MPAPQAGRVVYGPLHLHLHGLTLFEGRAMTGRMGCLWNHRRNLVLTLVGLMVTLSCMAGSCQPLGESPMSFSPDSRNLALTTIEPLRTDAGSFLSGPQAFRVMILSQEKHPRVLEERTDTLLTAAGYSTDGKRICYLRIPLLSEEQEKAQSEEVERRLKPLEDAVSKPWVEWWAGGGQPKPPQTQPASPDTQPASTQPAIDITDTSLPPVTGAFSAEVNTVFLPSVTAQVVVRDARTGQVVSEAPVELPKLDHQVIYMNTRPEFDPTGQWVYFAAGQVVMAVNPASGEKRVLAVNSLIAKLSPDGKTLAVRMDGDDKQCVIGLIATDGQMALYRRLPFGVQENPAWIDNDTLALPSPEPQQPSAKSQPTEAATQPTQPEVLMIQRLRKDGTLLTPTRIVRPKDSQESKVNASGLAIAPDGKHMVLGNVFMTTNGHVLSILQSDKAMSLSQPVFSPDSRQVAFKIMREIGEKTLRTEGVVFCSSDGKILNRVEIPPIKPGTTRPAATRPQDGT